MMEKECPNCRKNFIQGVLGTLQMLDKRMKEENWGTRLQIDDIEKLKKKIDEYLK